MDWVALWLSLELSAVTLAVLAPVAIVAGRWLAFADFHGKGLAEAAIALPLVLPPTVLGYYLMTAMSARSPLGQAWTGMFGSQLVFSFGGLVAASVIVNLPFAIQPAQRGFEAIPAEIREAASTCGMNPWRRFLKVELPLAWPGLMTAMVLSFAHTLGEFGVVLMVGGSIPGETKTIAIAIYDRVQGFDDEGAATMSAVLMLISVSTIAATFALSRRIGRRLG